MDAFGLSKKISAYRAANGLTLMQMAEQTGLSNALLSQLERNLANPSLSVLKTLADTLGISVSELLEEEVSEESLILRASQRERTYPTDNKYISYNLLTPSPMKSGMEVMLLHLEPFSETFEGVFHCHRDEEVVYMLTGDVTVQYELAEIELHTGDTLRIPGGKKHRYRNGYSVSAELLTLKTTRNY